MWPPPRDLHLLPVAARNCCGLTVVSIFLFTLSTVICYGFSLLTNVLTVNFFGQKRLLNVNVKTVSSGCIARTVNSPNQHLLRAEDVVSCCLDLSVPSISFRINGQPVQGMFENFNSDGLFFPVASFSAGVKSVPHWKQFTQKEK